MATTTKAMTADQFAEPKVPPGHLAPAVLP